MGLLSVLVLVSLASLLTVQTLQVQHSCHPILEWSDTSTRECPLENSDVSGSFQVSDKPQSINQPKLGQTQGSLSTSSSKENPGRGEEDSNNGKVVASSELAGIAAASVAVVGLTVMGTPIAIAAGVGAFVWIAAKVLISSGS